MTMKYFICLIFGFLLVQSASSIRQFLPVLYPCPFGCSQIRCTQVGCIECQPQYCHHMRVTHRRIHISCLPRCPEQFFCQSVNINGATRRFCLQQRR